MLIFYTFILTIFFYRNPQAAGSTINDMSSMIFSIGHSDIFEACIMIPKHIRCMKMPVVNNNA